MRTFFLTSAIALVGASAVSAQYTNQSDPFNLIVLSSNSTVNGSVLYSCHEGAAIEGLCLGGAYNPPEPAYSRFTFNVTSTPYTGNASIGETGYLTYELQGANFVESEPLIFDYNPTSNVAVPLFYPQESGQLVAFDNNDLLNLQGYTDDTTSPITTAEIFTYYRWYTCATYVGYSYTTLAWALGNAAPENPSCVKVDVKRIFV